MLHTRLTTALLGVPAALLVTPLASGQGFNLDFNNVAGTPSSSYGAASGQAGTWNDMATSVPLAPVVLNDLSGAASSVTIEIAPGPNGYNGLGPYNYNCSGTSGDEEALIDDILDVGGGFPQAPSGIFVTVKGLAENTYDIYTYSYAPDNELPGNGGYPWITLVDVIGSASGQQQVGTVFWPATGHVLGETYAKHTISVPAGVDLLIRLDSDTGGSNPGSFGSLNGLQIVETGGGAATFCTSKPSSIAGCTPALDVSSAIVPKGGPAGSTTWSASPVPGGGNPGIFIYNRTGTVQNPASTQFGFICVIPFLRAGAYPQLPGGSPGNCDGAYGTSSPVSADFQTIVNGTTQILAGDTTRWQLWYRDSPNPGGANMTNAVGPITH